MKTLAILAVLSLSACAGHGSYVENEKPAYWMKEYPNAPQAKVDRCLIVAEEAYAKNLKGGMDGVASAVLWKGNAWEKCMDGK